MLDEPSENRERVGLAHDAYDRHRRYEEDDEDFEIEKDKTQSLSSEDEVYKSMGRTIFEYARVILIGVLVAVLLLAFVVVNAQVPTSSMVSTIPVGSRLFGNRVIYYFSDPERGDIVIFRTPNPADEGELYVKRVIGLPGETVRISAGEIYITTVDGEEFHLVEDYLYEEPNQADLANNQTVVLADNEYYTLGDNRNHSNDSRSWGPVTRDRIIAKVFFRYYPGFRIYGDDD